MRLEIDIGNTLLKWRLVEASAQPVHKVLVETLSQADFQMLEDYPVEEVLIGSVAHADVRVLLDQMALNWWGVQPCYAETSAFCAGVYNSYQEPERMGVDRWLAMVAAYQALAGAVITVSCGSAITIDYLDQTGRHLGGYILPGLQMMRRTLVQDTARVRFDEQLASVSATPGTSTAEAVEHGTHFVFKALADKLVLEASQAGAKLLFTGGDGELMQRYAQQGRFVPTLAMDGLQWVCQRA